MTAFFFDSSTLVKRYVTETGTLWVRATVAPGAGNDIFVAQIAPVETVSALERRKREGNISARTAQAARLFVDRHTRREYKVVVLSNAIIHRAEDLLGTHPLRASDAIQLASALEINARLTAVGMTPLIFVCADARLLSSANAEGLQTHQPA